MEILKATEVQKQDGWKAETTVKKFGMDWEIYTRKGRGGTLVSHAQSGTYTPAGVEGHFSSFQYVTFQSPAVQLATVKGRATEKAVTAAHAQALEEFKKLESYK